MPRLWNLTPAGVFPYLLVYNLKFHLSWPPVRLPQYICERLYLDFDLNGVMSIVLLGFWYLRECWPALRKFSYKQSLKKLVPFSTFMWFFYYVGFDTNSLDILIIIFLGYIYISISLLIIINFHISPFFHYISLRAWNITF